MRGSGGTAVLSVASGARSQLFQILNHAVNLRLQGRKIRPHSHDSLGKKLQVLSHVSDTDGAMIGTDCQYVRRLITIQARQIHQVAGINPLSLGNPIVKSLAIEFAVVSK